MCVAYNAGSEPTISVKVGSYYHKIKQSRNVTVEAFIFFPAKMVSVKAIEPMYVLKNKREEYCHNFGFISSKS